MTPLFALYLSLDFLRSSCFRVSWGSLFLNFAPRDFFVLLIGGTRENLNHDT
jgi:hypothetical protein